MPELYKKFRDSQGLASISQALRASQKAKEANPPEKGKTRRAAARKETRSQVAAGQKQDVRGAGKPKTEVQLSTPATAPNKKGKSRAKESGQHDRDAEAPDVLDLPRKKKRKAEACASSTAVRNVESSPAAAAHGHAADDPTGSTLHESGPPAQTFRDFYVKTFSSAFATELFDLRQAEGEKFTLDLLLRHMESGVNIFSDTERELLQHRESTS